MSQVISNTVEPMDVTENPASEAAGHMPSTGARIVTRELDEYRPAEQFEEFSYIPVTPLAPITLFFGLFSITSLLGMFGLAFALVGTIVGVICMLKIRKAQGELGGRTLGGIGLALSVLFLIGGSGYHSYLYATECPEGYQRVSFNWISKQAPTYQDGKLEIAPAVAELDEKPIFIKGYMYPTRQLTGISEFVLVKDTGECCFGGQPKPTDMIVVQFKNGKTVNHREQQLVAVSGIFKAKQVVQSGQLTAIYSLEGTHFQ